MHKKKGMARGGMKKKGMARGGMMKKTKKAKKQAATAMAMKKAGKKPKKKIESKKLNNDQQNDVAKLIVNGEDQADLTIGHVASTTGSYRRGRLANTKN